MFLLTVFFFILINNLLGLTPGAANVTGNISGSSVSSGSFSIVSGSTISGDGSGLSSSIPINVVSGAAQLADNISGSFTNGFEFTGDISGSVNSTGSFGNLFVESKSLIYLQSQQFLDDFPNLSKDSCT